MFTRLLTKPKISCFLLGPRGTGKSTWLKLIFPSLPYYDLLNTSEALRLSMNPSVLFNELSILPRESWVIIDEIQKVPNLLNEVHRLIEEKGINFILSGSSARKLRKAGANLLAGRALMQEIFTFVSTEVGFNFDIEKALTFGMLPMSFNSNEPTNYLRTYTQVYLQEEIKEEALTRNIGSFARFLEVAARQNGQITNLLSISRDAQVARQTVQGYFDILKDTLIGYWLETWKLKRSTKQVSHPKFYFFDTGVARALSGRLPYPPSQEELGPLLETFLINEIRAYISYSQLYYPIYFWSSPDNVEVDLLCETKTGFVAFEFKASKNWNQSYGKGLRRIYTELNGKVRTIGVYMGERPALVDKVDVIPVMDFLKQLWEGNLIQ